MFVAVIFCIFGVACAQHMHPHGCCVDREFEVVMGEVGGSIVTEHGIPTPKLHQGFNILHYDYYSRKMAVESHLRQDDGTLKLAHVLYDFFNDKTYIMSTGSCNVTTIPPSTHFREPCILPDAKFLGETYMGYGVSKVPLMNWEMKTLTNHNLTVRVAVTKEGCTPIIEAIYGYADRSGNEFDLVYVFNNYHPGIRRRDVFNVPHICNQGHQKTWDDHLKLKAERWAQKCRYERPDLKQNTFSRLHGHNLYYSQGTTSSWHRITRTIDRALNSWIREKEYFQYGVDCGSACSYVQMVFAKTNKIGCALSYCQYLRAGKYWIRHATLFVCYYSPRGNLVGEYPYLGGAVCSKCPYGTTCDHGGLCSPPVYAEFRAAAPLMEGGEVVEDKPAKETSLGDIITYIGIVTNIRCRVLLPSCVVI